MHFGIFSNIPVFYQLGASSIPPNCENKKLSLDIAKMFSGGQNCPWLRTTALGLQGEFRRGLRVRLPRFFHQAFF